MKEKILKTAFLVLGISLVLQGTSTPIFADTQNISDREMQLQERRLEEKRINRILEEELMDQEKDKEEDDISIQSGKKFFIKKITLINADKISVKEKLKLIKKYVNNDLGIGEIHNLVKDLTNSYIKKGYVAARVTLPINQNIAQGELKLKIFEGKIENVLLVDRTKNKSDLKKNLNLIFKKGDTVNLKRIEFSEANLSSATATEGKFKLNPGTKIGQTIIIGDVKETKLGTVDINYDNLGSMTNGKHNIKIGTSTGNLLGISDTLFFQGTSSITKDDEKYSRSGFIDYKMPIGLWEVGGTYNYSQTKSTIEGTVRNTLNETNSSSVKFKLGKTLYDGVKGKIKLASALSFKDSKTYIEKSLVDVSSYKSSSEQLDLSYSGVVKGGSIFVKLSYVRGLGSFGADKDQAGSEAKRQYDKYKFYTRFYRPFKLKNQSLAYEFSVDSQYSPDTLYSADKMSIGDDVTVRGFKNSVSGENGFYVRNQIDYTFLSDSKNLILKNLNKTKFYIGLDYGLVRNSSNKGSRTLLYEESIASVAVGLYKSFKYSNISLVVGVPIHYPDYLEIDKKGRIYVTAGLTF